MAVIQNSKIIQKIIDELELYPALDKVPTELAEKVLPVFQVNSETLQVSTTPSLKYYEDLTTEDYDKTFSVPAGKMWKFKHLMANIDLCDGDSLCELQIRNKDDEIMFIVQSEKPNVSTDVRFQFMPYGHTYPKTTNTPYPAAECAVLKAVPDNIYLDEGWSIRVYAFVPAGATYMKVHFVVEEENTTFI